MRGLFLLFWAVARYVCMHFDGCAAEVLWYRDIPGGAKNVAKEILNYFNNKPLLDFQPKTKK